MSVPSTDHPFAMDGYESILRSARERGYSIGPLGQWNRLQHADPALILRHDVDYSLKFALAMAEWEAERGITSSYFVLPHGDFYNALDREGRCLVRAISALGHEIGMHWDGSLYPESRDGFERAFLRDLDQLSEVIEADVRSVSQHQPTMNRLVDIGSLVSVDAYARSVRDAFEYISDSCMSWRGVTPWELLESRRNIQFLAHPIWWVAEGVGTRGRLEVLGKAMKRAVDDLVDEYDEVIQDSLHNRGEHDATVVDHWSTLEDRANSSSGVRSTSSEGGLH